MGKTNGRMPKSRENIEQELKDISPEILSAINDDLDTVRHHHDWHFAKETMSTYGSPMSKFVCLCGAVKRVKQFEVEE